MQKKSKPTPKKKQDPLAPYHAQARQLIELYFNPKTPAFIEDLLSSFFTRLETETQIFWNRRDVLEIVLPLWLQYEDRDDLSILSAKHPICISALHESLSCNSSREEEADHLSPALGDYHRLQSELEGDAAAIARILSSPHTPTDIKNKLGDVLNDLMNETNTSHESSAVLSVAYPLAVRAAMREAEGSAGDEAE
jgi:hypothetical protein